MPPKLRDVVEKVLTAGKMDQGQLAVRLYGSAKKQGKISTMMGANDESSWEKHWQVCARLVPIAVDLKVITAHDLLDLPVHGSKSHHGDTKTGGSKANTR